MQKKLLIIALVISFLFAGCAAVQSVIKSTFPYTGIVVIPRNSPVKTEQSVTGTASSFDQRLTKSGNTNAGKVSNVRMVSAKLQSKDPSDFNIGNLLAAKVYLAKGDGSGEVLVASRTDIMPGAGNSIVLDIDNSNSLDELLREKNIQVRLAYRLRNHIDVTANLKVILNISANSIN